MTDYTITPARHAKGQMIVRCPSEDGFKSRAARLIGDGLNCRYSRRPGGYTASPTKAKRFEALFAAGYDANVISGALIPPSPPAA